MDSEDSDSDNNHPLEMLGDEDSSDESFSLDEDDEYLTFDEFLQRVHQNDPDTTELEGIGNDERVQNMTDDEWEVIGEDISNNTHLKTIYFYEGALNEHKMSFFFRGLTRSVTIKHVDLSNNELSIAGVRSMVPFLQNSNHLTHLHLNDNNLRSEGINLLFQALRDSPIKMLNCDSCGIESIEIDRNNMPQNLKYLLVDDNNINADGCRGLAKLLQGANATLTILLLDNNQIDDEGVAILVDALQNNTSLETLDLRWNDDVSNQGKIMLLQLVSDTSSIKATLQSNHTLRYEKQQFRWVTGYR